MAIQYALYKNNVVENATDYVARVLQADSVGMDQVADQMIKNGCRMSKTWIIAIQGHITIAVGQLLEKGVRVDTGLCSFRPVIKGRFKDSDNVFDESVNKLDVLARANPSVRKHVRDNVSLVKKTMPVVVPNITSFLDVESEQENTSITIGSIGKIKGSNLKLHRDAPAEGIFFHANGKPEIHATVIQRTTSSCAVFQIPMELEPDTCYQITVRARYTQQGSLREGRLPFQLKAVKSPAVI